MPIRNSTVPLPEMLEGVKTSNIRDVKTSNILKLLKLCDYGWYQLEGTVCAPAASCYYLPL